MPKLLTLDEIRVRRNLTQQALAARTGLYQSQIANLELGRHKPTQATLDKLASALGEQVYRARYGWAKVYRKRGRPRRSERAEGQREQLEGASR